MKQLLSFLKPYKRQLILGPTFKLMEAILELMLPFFMAKIIDIGVENQDKKYIIQTSLLMLLLAVVGAICAVICQYMASLVSQGVGTNLRNTIFKKIQSLSHAEIDRFGTASFINRITNDVNQLQLAVAMLIRLVIRAPFLCIGGLVMAVLIDVKLSIIMFIALPIFILILFIIMKKTIPLYRMMQTKLDNITRLLRETLSGVRVIRAFSKIDYEKNKFEKSNKEYADYAVHVTKIASLLNPITVVILNFSIIAIIWFGGVRVDSGYMTTGMVIAYINYIMQILAALIVISQLVILYTKAFASGGRVVEILNTKPSITEAKELQEIPATSEDIPIIEFQDVSVRYQDASEDSIKNLSFKVREGETVGIIGGTGSGKTTLINLIPRFYDVTGGNVLINGMDIRKIKLNQLRKLIGIVLQKSILFTGTIEENIRWGNPNAPKEEVVKAAIIAQASEFIEKLPQKYETQIRQGGVNVSGGQKQRITIARALLKQPKILILDDSFNALDFVTDAALRKAIKENTNKMTTFIVTQRANTIQHADQIILLHEGEIVGLGKHEMLLETNDIYREIWFSQNTEGTNQDLKDIKDSKQDSYNIKETKVQKSTEVLTDLTGNIEVSKI